MMKPEGEGEWFDGMDPESFAAAARTAVENAEEVIRGRGQPLPKEYDVRLQVTAEGPLSGYRVLVSPRS
jgi:hypothetical protein